MTSSRSSLVGTFCRRRKSVSMTRLRAFSIRQTDFTAVRNSSVLGMARSRRPEAQADDVPRGDENGDDAAGQGHEQRVNPRAAMNLAFPNANREPETGEREQRKQYRKDENTRRP